MMKILLFELSCVGDPSRSSEYAEAMHATLSELGLDVQTFTMKSVDIEDW